MGQAWTQLSRLGKEAGGGLAGFQTAVHQLHRFRVLRITTSYEVLRRYLISPALAVAKVDAMVQ